MLKRTNEYKMPGKKASMLIKQAGGNYKLDDKC
jgi:hypothetical protein